YPDCNRWCRRRLKPACPQGERPGRTLWLPNWGARFRKKPSLPKAQSQGADTVEKIAVLAARKTSFRYGASQSAPLILNPLALSPLECLTHWYHAARRVRNAVLTVPMSLSLLPTKSSSWISPGFVDTSKRCVAALAPPFPKSFQDGGVHTVGRPGTRRQLLPTQSVPPLHRGYNATLHEEAPSLQLMNS